MRLRTKTLTAIRILRQRNLALVVMGFLMIVNGILVGKLCTFKTQILVIPAMNEPEKQYHLEGDHVPNNYLVDWAANMLSLVYTVNPETIDQKTALFMKWSVSASAMAADLKPSIDRIKKEKISTAFYPESFQVDRGNSRVHVTGRFLSYFGKSQRPVEVKKTFVLGWEILPSGAIAIKSLHEREDK